MVRCVIDYLRIAARKERKRMSHIHVIGRAGELAAGDWFKEHGCRVYGWQEILETNEPGFSSCSQGFNIECLYPTNKKLLKDTEKRIGRKLTKREAYYVFGYRLGEKLVKEIEKFIQRKLSFKEKVFMSQTSTDYLIAFSNKTVGLVEVKTSGVGLTRAHSGGKNRQGTVLKLLKGCGFPVFVLKVSLKEELPDFKLTRFS